MIDNNENGHLYENRSFSTKVWIAGSILALLGFFIFIFKSIFSILLLVLAGALIALFFYGFAKVIHRFTPLKGAWPLILSIVISLSFITGIGWLIGAKLETQIAQLADTFPSTVEAAKKQIKAYPLGERALNKLNGSQAQNKLKGMAKVFLSSTFGLVADIYVVLFMALFFTADPNVYRKGILKLIPPKGRSKANDVMMKIVVNLQKWLAGKIFAMVVVFILTSILLLSLGIPMWLPLALMAALLNFIPNFGPLLAAIPATLVALTISPTMAIVVALSYGGIQVIESNFITPLAQQKLIKVPPALIIFSQLVVGTFSGGWGLLLATPLLVIVMMLVQELYVNNMPDLDLEPS